MEHEFEDSDVSLLGVSENPRGLELHSEANCFYLYRKDIIAMAEAVGLLVVEVE